MTDFEKLGVFYLGRTYDLEAGAVRPDLVLYDAKDLTTHAVCVGMTGSGKTGLCLVLLEEAAIDGIPTIAIDPKGDLGNLLLAFPSLQSADFRPWIDVDEATRRGSSPDDFAAGVAEQWKKGLAEWGQTPERIARYRAAVDLAIYTPGSRAGLPLRVLRSFAAPSDSVLENAELLREQIQSVVSGLLALLGIDADPIRSREHILLSNLLDHEWREGRSPDMGALIRGVQTPPFDKIGVMDLESIFPATERYSLAMQLNNLLAAPGFSAWMEGEPLDVQRLLYTSEGRPRLSVISIAHLSDSERMFLVTTLLNEVIAWMRAQPGTSSLRALLYMDEVFGYFPPTANPPSKTPMLTLLKQARAFGLGIVLATQNPVDLDYKGLSNAGTWWLGRLQTERDKARVLDGLEGASSSAGRTFDRARMEAVLSGLGNRVFLMNNVHDDAPVVFQSRWALSYLRGPLTRAQIETLMQPRKQASAAAGDAAAATSTREQPVSELGQRPVVPPGIDELFLSPRGSASGGAKIVYRPALFGSARVHFVKTGSAVDTWESVALLAPTSESPGENPWAEADPLSEERRVFSPQPLSNADFASLPSELTRPKNYAAWKTALKNHVYEQQILKSYACPTLKEQSKPGESEADFRVRIRQRAAENRDLEVEKLRKKYAPKLLNLNERIRKSQQHVEREQSQVTQQTLQTALSVGTTVLGALFGRKLTSTSNVTRAASTMRQAGRTARERGDVQQARENVESLQQQLTELEESLEREISTLQETLAPDAVQITESVVRARKSDLIVERVALAWTPWRVDSSGIAEPA